MAKSRAILKRRKSVQNICKITKTMQLISTARFQRAFKRVTDFRPYSERITQMVSNIAKYATIDHPLLRTVDKPARVALLAISANRGLCGGYNGQVLHKAVDFHNQLREDGRDVQFSVVGKKGAGYLSFVGIELAERYMLDDTPTYQQVEEIAGHYQSMFINEEVDEVYIAYMKFHSTARQRPELLKVLPSSPPAEPVDSPFAEPILAGSYEFEPSVEELLGELLPEALNVRFYQSFIDASLSEHVARMVAMKAATDNASEMIVYLGRQANKARQAQITGELCELMAGTEG